MAWTALVRDEMNISEIFIRRPVMTILVTAAVVIAGL
jgi:hypothetical protein